MDGALGDLVEVEMGGGGLHNSERESDGEHKFKPCRVEADWFNEGRQEDDWTRVMVLALRLTAWERGSDVENRLAAKNLGNIFLPY